MVRLENLEIRFTTAWANWKPIKFTDNCNESLKKTEKVFCQNWIIKKNTSALFLNTIMRLISYRFHFSYYFLKFSKMENPCFFILNIKFFILSFIQEKIYLIHKVLSKVIKSRSNASASECKKFTTSEIQKFFSSKRMSYLDIYIVRKKFLFSKESKFTE